MKIGQFYKNDQLRLGLIENDSLIPIEFPKDMMGFIDSEASPRGRGEPIGLDQVDWAPPITSPSKIIAVGLNYKDHAEESKGKVPEAPLIFGKFPNSLLGHRGEIIWDESVTRKVDFEAELAVIIGKSVKKCPAEKALDAVFGYCCANDVSARDLQFGDGQWVRGKSLDTFCPLGPWIVTADELPDAGSLGIRCWLNGNLMQDSSTRLMIFGVSALVHFLSMHFTLLPGDVILTGTPAGVGVFREPSEYMKHGDAVVVEIEGIGRLENTCRTHR